MTPTMFISRRKKLLESVDGAIFLPGLNFAPRNYPKNCYPFRQDSHFIYFTGISYPGLALLVFPNGRTTLYGTPQSETDIVWEGPHTTLEIFAWSSGIDEVKPFSEVEVDIGRLQQDDIRIHYLPPYRHDIQIMAQQLLRQPLHCIHQGYSRELAEAVVLQRIKKSDEEVAQIEKAIAISQKMYDRAFSRTREGQMEYEIVGAMEEVAIANQGSNAFMPIVTVHGEVLHNNRYDNPLKDGQLLLIDTGVEVPPFYYGSDITRTIPVSGKFTAQQKGIYEVVLNAQLRAIAMAGPTLSNKDVHMEAALAIVEGLKDLNLMTGDAHEAVQAGAHTLLFPHGIGHMLGIDSHDMEDLGDFVAYPKGEKPPATAGLQNLRLGRKLEPGFVVTAEPGIYFIPALIDRWTAEKKHDAFVNYAEVAKYRDFGGIRIEDDILITQTGCRVLGPPIAKSVADIEAQMNRGQ